LRTRSAFSVQSSAFRVPVRVLVRGSRSGSGFSFGSAFVFWFASDENHNLNENLHENPEL